MDNYSFIISISTSYLVLFGLQVHQRIHFKCPQKSDSPFKLFTFPWLFPQNSIKAASTRIQLYIPSKNQKALYSQQKPPDNLHVITFEDGFVICQDSSSLSSILVPVSQKLVKMIDRPKTCHQKAICISPWSQKCTTALLVTYGI